MKIYVGREVENQRVLVVDIDNTLLDIQSMFATLYPYDPDVQDDYDYRKHYPHLYRDFMDCFKSAKFYLENARVNDEVVGLINEYRSNGYIVIGISASMSKESHIAKQNIAESLGLFDYFSDYGVSEEITFKLLADDNSVVAVDDAPYRISFYNGVGVPVIKVAHPYNAKLRSLLNDRILFPNYRR